MQHDFSFISLPSLHDYDVKIPNFKFMEDVNKRQRIFLSLSKLECGPTRDKVQKNVNSTFLLPLPSSMLKLPGRRQQGPIVPALQPAHMIV